mmetsp:Transcript_158899/g.280715  ORF Transcript_158899/g.280715 Transcript_158899/m.280715 type:complete len:357 (-) Transcript_158899:112-1182(-)
METYPQMEVQQDSMDVANLPVKNTFIHFNAHGSGKRRSLRAWHSDPATLEMPPLSLPEVSQESEQEEVVSEASTDAPESPVHEKDSPTAPEVEEQDAAPSEVSTDEPPSQPNTSEPPLSPRMKWSDVSEDPQQGGLEDEAEIDQRYTTPRPLCLDSRILTDSPPGSKVPPSPASPFMLFPGGACFGFTLRRADDVGLGLEVAPCEDGRGLHVDSIKSGGAIEAWNRQCVQGFDGSQCSKVVIPGDMIVSVNGKQESKAMAEQCWSQRLLKIVVRRCSSPGSNVSPQAYVASTWPNSQCPEMYNHPAQQWFPSVTFDPYRNAFLGAIHVPAFPICGQGGSGNFLTGHATNPVRVCRV